MTCDSQRPCQRCIQKGLQETCKDAPRKVKKYLADVPLDELSRSQLIKSNSEDVQNSPLQAETLSRSYSDTVNPPFIKQENFGSINLIDQDTQERKQNKRSKFMSTAADLEYSSISNIILDNFMSQNPTTSNEVTPSSINLSPVFSPKELNTGTTTDPNAVNDNNSSNPNSAIHDAFVINDTRKGTLPPIEVPKSASSKKGSILNHTNLYDDSTKARCDESINQYFLGPTDSNDVLIFSDVTNAIELMKENDPSTYYERNAKLTLSFAVGILPDDSHYARVGDPQNDIRHYFKEPEEIYAKVNKPYSYTPGYHSLIAYLRKRFPKEMLVKMAESMASYRPSFIACTNSLKEHDLIFMEQCFQRTLLTYDNHIKISGTPTIVWRRTGEIAYVGNEFCLLTGWSKEELLSKKKTFIVELLDDKSVLEYFQLFLKIAFGDFLGATMTECTLLTPKKDSKIRTGCMWTLKRDVFGTPMMIIGNFLPIV